MTVPTRGGGTGCVVLLFVVLVPVILILGLVMVA
jgi:hypothetical protein